MKVFIPLLNNQAFLNYFPFPSEHIVAYSDMFLVERIKVDNNLNLEVKCLEIPDVMLEIKASTSAVVSFKLHEDFLCRESILLRPLYSKYCKSIIVEPLLYNGNRLVQFEKEMETNTDKEVLIPISLYESLVNQDCSQE